MKFKKSARTTVFEADSLTDYVVAGLTHAMLGGAGAPPPFSWVLRQPSPHALEGLASTFSFTVRPLSSLEKRVPGFFRAGSEQRRQVEQWVAAAEAEPAQRPAAALHLLRVLRHLQELREVEARAWQEAWTAPRPLEAGGERALVVARNDGFLWAAVAFAYLTGRELCVLEDWRELGARLREFTPRSVAVFAEPRALGPDTVVALYRECAHIPWGLMTARALPALTFLVFKTELYRQLDFGKALTITSFALDTPGDDWNEYLELGQIQEQHHDRLVSEPLELLSLAGHHGDELDADLHGALLCSRVSSLSGVKLPATPAEAAHTCLTDDLCRRDVERKVRRIAADQLRCKVIFNGTCTGMALGSVSLVLGLVEGWAGAYLSSMKILRIAGYEPFLVTALLRRGVSLGEVAGIMRSFQQQALSDLPGYVLVGDPEARVCRSEPARHLERRWPAGSPHLELDLKGLDSPLTTVAITQEDGAGPPPGARLVVEVLEAEGGEGRRDPLYCMLLRDVLSAPLVLFLFAAGAPRLARLKLRVVEADRSGSAIRTEARALERSLSFLNVIARKTREADGLRPGPTLRRQAAVLKRISQQGDRAERLARTLFTLVEPPVIDVHRPNPSALLLGRVRRMLQEADEQMTKAWPSWRMPQYLVPFYDGYLSVRDQESPAGPCYLCGTPVSEYSLRSPLRDDIARRLTQCPRCGLLSDRPEGEPLMELRGVDGCKAGDVLRQELHVSNPRPHPRTYSGCLTFFLQLPWFQYRFTPRMQQWTVPEGASGSTTFDCRVDPSSSAGIYTLLAFTVSQLGVNTSSKPIAVKESS